MIWVLVAVALAASAFALWRRSVAWALAAAGLYLPFALYLALSPAFRWQAPLIWLAYAAAAYALQRRRPGLALLLSLPAFGLAAYLGWLVLTQPI